MSGIQLFLILAAFFMALAAVWARRDFLAWTELGPGGLPHTMRGWLRMSWLRLQKGESIRTYPLDPLIDSEIDGVYLGALVHRAGPRPRVAPHPIPQRQTNQHGTTKIRHQLDRLFDESVLSHGDVVRYELSFFEKHTPAVTLCHPECGHVYALSTHGEVGHVHPSDGSMHMILSPSDTKAAIEAGWGERHSLSGKLGLPMTYLFVYTPRDDAELEVTKELLKAAIQFMAARKTGSDDSR